jgi:hypothetical protein
MAKKRKNYPSETPEEKAYFEETRRLVQERIAYHEAKAREAEELRVQGRTGA